MRVRIYHHDEQNETYSNVTSFSANTENGKVLLKFGPEDNPTDKIMLTGVKNLHTYEGGVMARKYPIEHGTYRGFTITETSGFLTNTIKARRGDELHTRKYRPANQSQDKAIESLKKDIDRYATHD